MSLTIATWLARVFEFYLLFGALFAVAFAWRGAARVDPSAREGTWGFRLLILPGSALLWPLLALRWSRGWLTGNTEPPGESNAHRDQAGRSAEDTAAGGDS